MTTTQREIDLRIIHSLRTYIERLEKERDDLVTEGIHREAARWSLMVAAVAAQLGEAVGRVTIYHGAEIRTEQKAGHDTHDLQGCDVCRFLSTVTKECNCDRDPSDGGHTPECNRMKKHQSCERVSGVCPKCGFDFSPSCERVTMGCCPKCCEHLGFKCAYHGCPWPDEGECPTRERPLGRPPLGTTGGSFPVG